MSAASRVPTESTSGGMAATRPTEVTASSTPMACAGSAETATGRGRGINMSPVRRTTESESGSGDSHSSWYEAAGRGRKAVRRKQVRGC
jgi:hypothetical protein